MLVGREAECAAIVARLDRARAGQSSTLVLCGDAGIGKTTLLEYAETAATGFRILRTSGREAETHLGFVGLFDLFRPVLDLVDRMPERQGAALAGALAIGPPVRGDRFTVAAATLSLLAVAAEDEPVLVLVDDAQWLDAASREALLFAIRRLGEEGVVVLIARREGEAGARDFRGIAQLDVGGLDVASAKTILDDQTGAPATTELASRLWEAAGGNPLAMLEMARVLTAEQLAGREQVESLPAAATVEDAFLRRVDQLDERTRRALLVAAAAGAERRQAIDDACRVLGLSSDALAAAERDGLVISDGRRLRFYHPLVRSAVYRAASEAGRRDAHRALAAVLLGEEWSRERVWHESEAAAGPDEAIAASLEQAAVAATRQNAPEVAARSYERAAHLTITSDDRARRLLRAAQQWQLAGDADTAIALLDESLPLSRDPSRRTEIEELRGRALASRGQLGAGNLVLLREAARIEQHDAANAVRLMSDACMLTWMAGDAQSAVAIVEHCYVLGRRVGGGTAVHASLTLGCSRLFQGHRAAASRLLLDAPEEITPNAPLIVVYGIGQLFVWLEDYPRAAKYFEALCGAAWAASAPSLLGPVLARRSLLHFRTGNWAAAYADTSEALRLADGTGQPAHYPLAFTATIEAARGDEQACQETSRRALDVAERLGVGSARCHALAALGHLALGLGRTDEAIRRLVEVKALLARWGIRDPGVIESAPDLIEALIRAGETDEARNELLELEHAAARTGSVSARAATLRYSGLLDEGEHVDELFLAALAQHDLAPRPFERARTELCFGERLRRARRKSDAREHLEHARVIFEQLGARSWAERARSELLALGIRVPRASSPQAGDLTPQELRVALAVSEGATNREASTALFLSPKTIEAHLSSVYRKLGVRSRTELASLLAGGQKRYDRKTSSAPRQAPTSADAARSTHQSSSVAADLSAGELPS